VLAPVRSDEAATRHLVLAWSKNEPTPMPTLSPFATESVTVEIDPRAEQLHGRYRLIRPLGAGPWSTVYMARSQMPSAPPIVAVKLLSTGLPLATLDAYLGSAQKLMGASHPNLLHVLDVGDAALPFVAMEYIEGCNLEELCQAGALPAAQAVAIAIALCHALTAARGPDGKTLVHGAIKPRNVLVDRHNAIKLGDFAAPAAPGDRFAPEQHEGKPADARSDVHAVGLLLHELLTHERYYPVDGQPERWPALPPPSSRRPDLPAVLDGVIARATSFKPRQRQRDAATLAEELASAASGLAAAAAPLSDFVDEVRRTR
jgi:serine/threonine-protein kinase